MGAPGIDISFIEKGISAITRGERGIVMLWVKDTLAEPAINPATIVTESDIPAGLSDLTVEQIKLAMMGRRKNHIRRRIRKSCRSGKNSDQCRDRPDQRCDRCN